MNDVIGSVGQSFFFLSSVEVQAHDFEGESLLVEFVGFLQFWLLDHGAQGALLPLIVVAFLPVLLGFLEGLFEVFLVLGVVELAGEVAAVAVAQVSIDDFDVYGADHDLQGFAQLSQIHGRPGERGQDGLGELLVEGTGGGDGHWVAVDHIEALLVNGVLALGLDYFLLARVPQQHILQPLVGHKAGTNRVVMHSFLPLVRKVLCDIEVRMLSWLHQVSVHLEGKGPEVAIVHSPPLHNLLPHVLPQGLDHQVELGLGIKGLD